jgi:hypothetical protein
MAALFSQEFWWLWALALALALFVPVRRLIWVLMVRRAERDGPIDDAGRRHLKQRAGVTAGLMCFVFAVVYVNHLFSGGP